MSINDNDKNGFMNAMRGLDVSKGLDLILHTPGGDIAATESLIDYLIQKFQGNMRAIVPHLAMSGGTLIACACREIVMGKQSSLGPVDPQINGLSASGILSEFCRANEEIKLDRDKINVWSPVISRYPPSLLETCKKAIAWTHELAEWYLSNFMFDEELKSDRSATEKTIQNIIHLLTDLDVTKSHSRHISMPICQKTGLKVVEMEEDQELQDFIMSVHHSSSLLTVNTPVLKIIENQYGNSYIHKYSPSENTI